MLPTARKKVAAHASQLCWKLQKEFAPREEEIRRDL
jgi:hypothetical protein